MSGRGAQKRIGLELTYSQLNGLRERSGTKGRPLVAATDIHNPQLAGAGGGRGQLQQGRRTWEKGGVAGGKQPFIPKPPGQAI